MLLLLGELKPYYASISAVYGSCYDVQLRVLGSKFRSDRKWCYKKSYFYGGELYLDSWIGLYIIVKARYLCRVEPFLASRLALRRGIVIEESHPCFIINMHPCCSGVVSLERSYFWFQDRCIFLLSVEITVWRGRRHESRFGRSTHSRHLWLVALCDKLDWSRGIVACKIGFVLFRRRKL